MCQWNEGKWKKEQRGRFLSMLLGTPDANLIGNLLSGKRTTPTSQGQGVIRAGEGFLMLPNSLTSFEIQKSQNDALVSSKNDSKWKKGWDICNKSWWMW